MSNGNGGNDVVTAGDQAVKEPADRAVGYGRQAADKGVRVAQAVPAKKQPKPSKPRHVVTAEAVWAALVPKAYPDDPENALMKDVKILDMKVFGSEKVRKSTWLAWTNSIREIYVKPGVTDLSAADKKTITGAGLDLAGFKELWTRSLLYHESLHVEQFNKVPGSKPPATFTEMLKHELEAYPATAKWVRAESQSDEAEAIASSYDDRTTAVNTIWTAGNGKANSEEIFRALILKDAGVHSKTTIGELYRP